MGIEKMAGEHTVDRNIGIMRFGFPILSLAGKRMDLFPTNQKKSNNDHDIKRW